MIGGSKLLVRILFNLLRKVIHTIHMGLIHYKVRKIIFKKTNTFYLQF